MVLPADHNDDLDDNSFDNAGFDDFDETLDQDMPLDDYDPNLNDDLGDDLNDGLDDYNTDLDENTTGPAQANPVARKKTSVVTIAIIAVAVIIGGAILFNMFLGAPPAPTDTVPASAEMAAQPDLPTDPTTMPAADPTVNSGGLADLQALDQQQLQQGGQDTNNLDGQNMMTTPEGAAATGAAPPQQGFMNDPNQLDGTASPAVPAEQNLPVPQTSADGVTPQNLPTIDQIKKADLPVPAPTTTTPPVQSLPVSATQVAAPAATTAQNSPTQREQELQTRLEEALKRLQAVEQKLAQTPVITANASSDGSAAEITALRTQLDRLTQRIDNMASAQTVSSPARSDAEPARAPMRRTTQKSAKSKPKVKKAATASSGWELRSAQPGQALVARSNGNDLKLVRIGDSIAGIGQVTAISQSGSRWVVTGTSGQISE